MFLKFSPSFSNIKYVFNYSQIIRVYDAHNEILSSLIKIAHHSYLSSSFSLQLTIQAPSNFSYQTFLAALPGGFTFPCHFYLRNKIKYTYRRCRDLWFILRWYDTPRQNVPFSEFYSFLRPTCRIFQCGESQTAMFFKCNVQNFPHIVNCLYPKLFFIREHC